MDRVSNFPPFSNKQVEVLTWWCENSQCKDKKGIICSGAVKSGKSFSMAISFIAWSFSKSEEGYFGICGKSIQSLKRNVILPIYSYLKDLGFKYNLIEDKNILEVTFNGVTNRFYLIDSYNGINSSISNKSFDGIFFDEVTLLPESFVEDIIAQCSMVDSSLWFTCNPESPMHWFYINWVSQCKDKNMLYLDFNLRDNPSNSLRKIEIYKSLYCGVYYNRFINGKWV